MKSAIYLALFEEQERMTKRERISDRRLVEMESEFNASGHISGFILDADRIQNFRFTKRMN
jgi:hypothetical protein